MNEQLGSHDGAIGVEPDSTRSGFFGSADGTRLYYEAQMPEARPRACVLIIHGYGEHSGRYQALKTHLADEGFSALAFDYRGHGKSAGRRGHCRSFDDFLRDLDSACALARGIAGDVPLVLLAHSHGGLVALRWLCEQGSLQDQVDAAVLSSPYLGPGFHLTKLESIALAVFSRVLPGLAFDNRIEAEQLTHDAELIAAHKRDALVHGVATARWFNESRLAQSLVSQCVGELAIPTLWLIGLADSIADPAVGLRIYERAGGPKSLRLYDGFYHELFNEVDRGRVISDVTDWLEARYPLVSPPVPSPPGPSPLEGEG